MSIKYVLRSSKLELPVTIDSNDQATVREVFLRSIDIHDLQESDVYSFFEVGKSERTDSYPFGNQGICISMWDRAPGAERIFEARNLPILSNQARAIIGGNFASAKSTLTMNNEKARFSDEAQEAISELMEAGLLAENEADNGFPNARTYSLTDAGKEFPRAVDIKWMSKYGRFPLTQDIDNSDLELSP